MHAAAPLDQWQLTGTTQRKKMIETCLKCGHVNSASTGDDAEACPQCGAIYSKVEGSMTAMKSARPTKRGTQFWTYAVLIGLLTVLVPIFVYQHTWGTAAKQRRSEASRNAVLREQRSVVFNSGLNGSVFQVERYLKANLKDPASLEVVEWSPVVSGPHREFEVRVKYRAKNGLGGYAIEHKLFRLDSSGTVLGVSDT
jgi:predicted  nucleic acid-binding Zn-ribbon protein